VVSEDKEEPSLTTKVINKVEVSTQKMDEARLSGIEVKREGQQQ
jgi:hypothetical protein